MQKHWCTFLLAFPAVLYPTAALANLVWAALVLENRYLSPLPIAIGLAVEILFLWFFLKLDFYRAAVTGIVMNIASALVGLPLIPAAGLAWEFFPGSLINQVLGMGTFNPVTWTAAFLIAVCVNTLVEGFTVKKLARKILTNRQYLMLAGANSVSVAVGLVWGKELY